MDKIKAVLSKVSAWLTPKRLLVIGFFAILIAPWLFTLRLGWIVFGEATGPIGDTIGGISAPITGLLGAYLVYKALIAQIEANRQVNEQFQIQRAETNHEKELSNLLERIKFIRDEVNDFSVIGVKYHHPSGSGGLTQETIMTYKGMEAIGYVLYHHTATTDIMGQKFMVAHLKHIEDILDRIQTIVFIKEMSSSLSYEEKNHLQAFIGSIYQQFLPYVKDNRHQLPATLLKKVYETNNALGWFEENQ